MVILLGGRFCLSNLRWDRKTDKKVNQLVDNQNIL